MKRSILFLVSLVVSLCTFAQADYLSYDWAFFEVTGRVASITDLGEYPETHYFSREGVLQGEEAEGSGQYNPYGYYRDSQGRITSIGNGHYSWKWNGMTVLSEHFACTGEESTTTFIYIKGRRTGEKVKGKLTNYKVLQSDSHGNWLKRKVGDRVLERKITYYDDASGSAADYEAVDLGLSVKWASCNVGAAKPEETGEYFAFGETFPKESYDWTNYKWCHGTANTMTKYCTNSTYGKVDNKKRLDLADDAARANMGGSWRMPTLDEVHELMSNCTQTLETLNGVKGLRLTARNGNSIFLPFGGAKQSGSDVHDAGIAGFYWTATLYDVKPHENYSYVVDNSPRFYVKKSIRFRGRMVRGVR